MYTFFVNIQNMGAKVQKSDRIAKKKPLNFAFSHFISLFLQSKVFLIPIIIWRQLTTRK